MLKKKNFLGTEDFMLIEEKKHAHRASYSHFIKGRQPISWVKKFPVKRFLSSQFRVTEILAKGGEGKSTFRKEGKLERKRKWYERVLNVIQGGIPK